MNRLHRLAAAALLAVPLAALPVGTVHAQPGTAARAEQSAFDRRAGQLVALFEGRVPYADYFAPSFRAAIPEARFGEIRENLVGQYGKPVAVERATSDDGQSGTILLRFERGTATIRLDVGPAPEALVLGLRVTGFVAANDSIAAVAAEIAALPGDTGFLVAEVDGDNIRQIAGSGADRPFAVGSIFKLYVLDELAAQVAAGKRHWNDVVPLAHPSFSSAATANWPLNTPVTLQTLANWMISVSDNGAADTLIHLLGREAIEARMRAAGNSAPARNTPFLTTVEAFALKGNNFADLRSAFLSGSEAEQRKIVDDNADRFTLANVDGVSFAGKPRFIDSLEWFASPMDVARAFADLRARRSAPTMAALAINNGVGPAAAADWSYLGYKGGSELGVVSMSLLGQRKADGKWFVVTASWNNAALDLDGNKFAGLVTRLLALAAQEGVTPSALPPAP
ncbi:serine hydrolase [Sphingopyxis sp.]|jgi:beta-lactamase class A|uniref:serine hydrolase n=1 Tax=Sphingopyxis sp. TaxID=1908224 RepID=UPI00311E703A